jgi:hypothetical protein
MIAIDFSSSNEVQGMKHIALHVTEKSARDGVWTKILDTLKDYLGIVICPFIE